MAILVDEKHPIVCTSHMEADPVLRFECRTIAPGGGYATETFVADQWSDFEDLFCHGAVKSCILLRAVVVALGVVNAR